jgi:hypothetical protein
MRAAFLAIVAMAYLGSGPAATAVAFERAPIGTSSETQYLVFGVAMDGVFEVDEKDVFGLIDRSVAELVGRVGTTGDGCHRRLGFAVYFPAWIIDRVKPERVPIILDAAFRVAAQRGVAVHVIIESHYFWETRPDLWNYFDPSSPGYDPDNRNNVEWSDWSGTPYPARFLDWGRPQVLPPHMCYACPRIRSEVARIARDVIGAPLRKSLDGLAPVEREDLFSGVTITSEPSVDNYGVVDRENPDLAAFMDSLHAAKVRLGYNALTRMGYGPSNPPLDFPSALGEINRQFASDWARALVTAGIPSKLYTHVAGPAGVPGWPGYDYLNAPLSAAFADFARPGWTTYPAGPLATSLEPIYEELDRHGNPPWGGMESSPAVPGIEIDPYGYLGWHYDHGAVVVVMNTGATDPVLSGILDRAVWGPAAIAAYRRFLTEAICKAPVFPPSVRRPTPGVVRRR